MTTTDNGRIRIVHGTNGPERIDLYASRSGENMLEDAPWLGSEEVKALREFFQAEHDAELDRWRSPEFPDYVVYPAADPNEAIVFGERTRQTHRVQREAGPSLFKPHEAAHAYFEAHPAEPPFPTEPGLYVPGDNVAQLSQTNVFRLSEDGRWSSEFFDRDQSEAKAREHHRTLGGLVRLTVEEAGR